MGDAVAALRLPYELFTRESPEAPQSMWAVTIPNQRGLLPSPVNVGCYHCSWLLTRIRSQDPIALDSCKEIKLGLRQNFLSSDWVHSARKCYEGWHRREKSSIVLTSCQHCVLQQQQATVQ